MKIEIPFSPDMKEAALNGTKSMTSRNRVYGSTGDYFELAGCKFTLSEVIKLPLWFVATYLYKPEGFTDSESFKTKWISLHPMAGYTPSKIVYVHVWNNE